MENAIWNGVHLIAQEVARKSYDYEKIVRMASARGELVCPDIECRHRRLCYRNGEKVSAYFAHYELENESCDYAAFDKENTGIMKQAALRLYEHFKEKGYQVRPEVKLLSHHYTHLVLEEHAIELGSKHMRAPQLEQLKQEYHKMHRQVQWIFIGGIVDSFQEHQTYFLKRSMLHEAGNHSLLVMEPAQGLIAQYKLDETDYMFEGRLLVENHTMFTLQGKIEDLIYEKQGVTLAGFEEAYQRFVTEGRHCYEEKVRHILEERRKRQNSLIEKKKRGKCFIVSMADKSGKVLQQELISQNIAEAFEQSVVLMKETGNLFLDIQPVGERKHKVFDCKYFSFAGQNVNCMKCSVLGNPTAACNPKYRKNPTLCDRFTTREEPDGEKAKA